MYGAPDLVFTAQRFQICTAAKSTADFFRPPIYPKGGLSRAKPKLICKDQDQDLYQLKGRISRFLANKISTIQIRLKLVLKIVADWLKTTYVILDLNCDCDWKLSISRCSFAQKKIAENICVEETYFNGLERN